MSDFEIELHEQVMFPAISEATYKLHEVLQKSLNYLFVIEAAKTQRVIFPEGVDVEEIGGYQLEKEYSDSSKPLTDRARSLLPVHLAMRAIKARKEDDPVAIIDSVAGLVTSGVPEIELAKWLKVIGDVANIDALKTDEIGVKRVLFMEQVDIAIERSIVKDRNEQIRDAIASDMVSYLRNRYGMHDSLELMAKQIIGFASLSRKYAGDDELKPRIDNYWSQLWNECYAGYMSKADLSELSEHTIRLLSSMGYQHLA